MIGWAILFGAFSYVHSNNAAKQQQMQTEAMFKGETEKLFTEEEISNVNYIAAYEKAYLEKIDYQRKSLFMQLDPNHISKAEAMVAVVTEDWSQSCSMAKVY